MKAKYSIIPFIPAVIVMVFLKAMSIYGVDSNGKYLGMNSMQITYTVIGISLALFVICVLINLFDRKTAPVYPVTKNMAAGVFAILTGFGMMASSITAATNVWAADQGNGNERLMLAVICAVLSIPAGLAMALIARLHFSGDSKISGLSAIYIFPSLWGCAELVGEFLRATKTSLADPTKDMTSLFCYIFIALYFFSNSMVVSRIKGRNPVKGMFIYGTPMAALNLTIGIYELFRMSREGFDREQLFFAFMFIFSALYAVSFMLEIFSNTYTKDDLEVIDALEEAEDKFSKKKDDKADDEIDSDTPEKPASSTAKKPQKKAQRNPEVKAEAESEKANTAENADDSPIGDLVFSNRTAKDPESNVTYDDDYYSTAKGMEDYIIGYTYESSSKKK